MVVRGCGTRKEDGLYVCVGSGAFGKPIEFFLFDPVVPFKMPSGHNIRAPLLARDADRDTYHLVMGIGATYYPFVPDFVEEARIYGVSKRIPRNFDFRKLDPKKSCLLLMHPRAIPNFSYQVDSSCPKNIEEPHLCIGDLWPLSACLNVPEKHEVEIYEEDASVTTPSVSYMVSLPRTMKGGGLLEWSQAQNYSSGLILQFPKFHFEYVRRSPKKVGDTVTINGKTHVLKTKKQAEEFNDKYVNGLQKMKEVYLERGWSLEVTSS